MPRGAALHLALLAAAAAPLAVSGCGDDPPDRVAGLVCAPRGADVAWFEEVSQAAGLDFDFVAADFRGGPIAVVDLDGDGRLDVLAGSRSGGLALFVNQGGLSFRNDTEAAGLEVAGPVHYLAPADFDNDGDRDLVVASDRLLLFESRGAGRFAAPLDLGDGSATEHVLPVDLDGDGVLELYVSNRDRHDRERSRNRLLRSRGGLDLVNLPGVGDSTGLSWTAAAIDVDGDGDLDLHVANDTLVADHGYGGPPDADLPVDAFYRNDSESGEIRLVDVAAELGLDGPRSSMDGLVADLDGDRRLDLYVTDFGRKKLFTGTGEGFQERAADLAVEATTRSDGICALAINQKKKDCLLLSWAAQVADFDGDGSDDLLVVNGVSVIGGLPPPAIVLRGPAPFQPVDAGLDCFEGHGAIAADLDDDGDPDLVAGPHDGPLRLYENVAPRRSPDLRIALEGRGSNRDGLGAVIEVRTASGRHILRAVGAGGVAHSSPPPIAEVSLGDDDVASIEVRWPSGARQQLTAPLERRLTVVEPAP